MPTAVIHSNFPFIQFVAWAGEMPGQAQLQAPSFVEITALVASLLALAGLYYQWRESKQKERELQNQRKQFQEQIRLEWERFSEEVRRNDAALALQQREVEMAIAEFEERFTSPKQRILKWAGSLNLETVDNLGVGGPYIVGPAIIDPNNFYGRQELLAKFFSGVVGAQLNSVSLTGVRRSGKTSFLYYISHPTVLQTHLGERHLQIVPVYLNMQAGITSPGKFYEYLAARSMHVVERGMEDSGLRPSIPDRVEFHFLEDFFDELCRHRLRFVLLLDEIERLAAEAGFDDDFFGTLRALTTGREIAWVTTSYLDVYQLNRELQSNSGIQLSSPFYNIFRPHYLHLGALSPDVARQVVVEPAAKVNHTYSGEDVEFVIRLAGRLPYFIQACASMLFNAQSRGEMVDSTYNNVRESFVGATQRHFKYYWERFTSAERRALSDLASNRSVSSQDQRVLLNLERHGFIERDGEEYEFLGTAFADWIRAVET